MGEIRNILRELIEKIEEPCGGTRSERERQCYEYDLIIEKAKKAVGMKARAK